MRCSNCGNEYMDEICPICGRGVHDAPRVTVLSRAEKDDFDGITIDQGDGSHSDDPRQQHARPEFGRVYVKQVNLGSSGGLLSKLFIVAMVLFVLFVTLPVAILLMLVGMIIWFFRRR